VIQGEAAAPNPARWDPVTFLLDPLEISNPMWSEFFACGRQSTEMYAPSSKLPFMSLSTEN
jgi:hypothetical protein